MKKILVVEDDSALSEGIAIALKTQELSLIICHTISCAREQILNNTFNMIILDINLPDGSGLNFLSEVKKTINIPVILLTANDMETDIVIGLEMGADDYITKPFSLAILRARVNTQLRKQSIIDTNLFQQECYLFDFEKMEFFKNSVRIELSKTEQRLLRLLVENKGVTLTRDVLIDRIWTDGSEYVEENALSVTIKRLRNKLEDIPSKPNYIKTIYGIGYTWAVN